MVHRKRQMALAYGFAFFSVGLALGLRFTLWSLLGQESPFIFFVGAVVLAAWYGGFGPGVLATLLSTPPVSFYLLGRHGQESFFGPAHLVQLSVFILVTTLISWLVENLHAARRRSEEAELEARKRAEEADEAKRILEAMMDYIPEGIVIAEGNDARIGMMSRFALGQIGRSSGDIAQRAATDRPQGLQLFHSDGVTAVSVEKLPLVRAAKLGEVIRGEEWLLKQAGGRLTPILCNAGPIRDSRGQIFGGVVAWSDITELKQAASELEKRVRERTAELARKHQQLESQWRLSRKVDSSVEGFLDNVLEELAMMSESPYGLIGILEDSEDVVSLRALSAEARMDCRMTPYDACFPISKGGLLHEVIDRQKPVIINSYSSGSGDRKPLFPEGHVQVKKLLVVPVVRGERTILLGAVANKEKDYTEEDAEQIHAFLSSALTVMEKKRAEDALRESQLELQRLSSELLTAQEAERLRISKELHDELGQALTMIKLRIGLIEMDPEADRERVLEHCENASALIDRVIEEMRRLSRDLTPAVLDNLGLTAALRRLAADSRKASNIDVSVEVDDIDHLFSQQQSILLYRVFQESMTNVMKHAEATLVKISAREKDGSVWFEVEDNGKGMGPEQARSQGRTFRRGMGLTIMSERVRTLGAALEIHSSKGSGTRLSFRVPVEPSGGGS